MGGDVWGGIAYFSTYTTNFFKEHDCFLSLDTDELGWHEGDSVVQIFW